ncbi:MAG: IS3 family transposase [Polyangiaceae bacterium]
MNYTNAFKAKMVQRLSSPDAISAIGLSQEVGVSQSQLSRWLRAARTVEPMTRKRTEPPAQVGGSRSAEDKVRIVMAAGSVAPEELGEFLRREGVHEAELGQWRAAILEALQGGVSKGAVRGGDSKRIKELERELRRKDKALAETAALLVLHKKSPGDLGGRGRRHRRGEREVILGLIEEAVAAGARREQACLQVGLTERCLQRWRVGDVRDDGRAGPRTRPANALSAVERAQVLAVVNSPAYRDLPPKQVVPRLADAGRYCASESTIYRILRAEGQLAHRGRAKPASVRRLDAHEATAPNQVWSWDITYLLSAVRGRFFYLYLVEDVWSRRIMGFEVHEEESMDSAAALVRSTCAAACVDPLGLVLHSDNGGPMRGSTMLATLQHLGIVASFSRPSVSDDNPYIESLFRTLKYRPEYPHKPFESIEQARAWVSAFVAWYNGEHRHSGIRFVTPDERHDGRENDVLARRVGVYERARRRHPARWSRATRNWTPVASVFLNPKRNEEGIAAARARGSVS